MSARRARRRDVPSNPPLRQTNKGLLVSPLSFLPVGMPRYQPHNGAMVVKTKHRGIFMRALLLPLLCLLFPNVVVARQAPPPPGPYISLHPLPALLDLRARSVADSKGQSGSRYPHQSQFHTKNRVTIQGFAPESQRQSDAEPQGAWQW